MEPSATSLPLTSQPNETEPAFGRTAVRLLTELAEQKLLIAAFTGSSMLIGLVYCLLLPIRYTSVTKIMPPKQTQSTTTLLNSQLSGGSLADVAGAGLSLKDPNTIYIGLLRSRPIADVIINRFDLKTAYGAMDMTAARKKLEDATRIASEKSGFIAVSVTDTSRSRAADMANTYTDQLRLLTKSISVTEASKRRLFFEDQLKDARGDLTQAETEFRQVQQEKGLVHLDAQAGVIVGSLASIRAEIAAKEVALEALLSYSTEHNPDVQLTERELSALRREEAQLQQHGSSSEFSELGLRDIPQAGVNFLHAQRDLQYKQAYFDFLLRQYEAARLDEAKDAAVIQVVEAAIPPDRKSSPMRMPILLFSTALGLFLGCLYARFTRWLRSEKSDPACARNINALIAALTIGRLTSMGRSE